MRIHFASLLVLAAACTNEAAPPAPHFILPVKGTLGAIASGHVPTHAFSFAPGTFNFTGPTAAGTASVTAASVVDPNTQPSTFGGGAYDVTLSGTEYTGAMQSEAMSVDDGMGTTYLVFGGYNLYTDAASVERVDQIVVLVKQSDFAVGATVALDGSDRVALFGTGPASADRPDVVGAAISGTVTFTAGGIAVGDTLTASIGGDFGPIDWTSGGGGGSGSGSGSGSIAAGTYTLAISGPGRVSCDGTLAGHEADFAAITPGSVSLGGGSVTVAVTSPSEITIDGSAIATGYGTTPLALDADPSGLFVGSADQTGSGPDATTLASKYLAFDPSSGTPVSGLAGAGYVTANADGTCSISFAASLAP
jgi:hypothetical protein